MRKLLLIFLIVCCCSILSIPLALAQSDFTWPVPGDIVANFDPGAHRGIDITASVGAEIVAAQDGVINWIGKTPRGEPCLTIEHHDGVTSTYLPVGALVEKGTVIKAGDLIGVLSSEIDPSTEGPHLHFGMYDTATRDNKLYVDPANYLPDLSAMHTSNNDIKAEVPAVEEGSEILPGEPVLPSLAMQNTRADISDARGASLNEQIGIGTLGQNTENTSINQIGTSIQAPAQAEDKIIVEDPKAAELASTVRPNVATNIIPSDEARVTPRVTAVAASKNGVAQISVTGTPNNTVLGQAQATSVEPRYDQQIDTEKSTTLRPGHRPGELDISLSKEVIAKHNIVPIGIQANPFSARNPLHTSGLAAKKPALAWLEKTCSSPWLPNAIALLAVLVIGAMGAARFVRSAQDIGTNAITTSIASC
ncbi:MAG TPA: M23 family metallopeptidase [Candidatus Aquicultor sp.]